MELVPADTGRPASRRWVQICAPTLVVVDLKAALKSQASVFSPRTDLRDATMRQADLYTYFLNYIG